MSTLDKGREIPITSTHDDIFVEEIVAESDKVS